MKTLPRSLVIPTVILGLAMTFLWHSQVSQGSSQSSYQQSQMEMRLKALEDLNGKLKKQVGDLEWTVGNLRERVVILEGLPVKH